jgi:hypothetical protein
MQLLDGLREELAVPKIPDAYTKAEKSMNGIIDDCIADLQQLKIRHSEHLNKRFISSKKFELMR